MTANARLKKAIDNRDLSELLNGDSHLETSSGMRLKMPYLSGNDIDFINKTIVGDKTVYCGPCSRWASMIGTLSRAIDTNTLNKVLDFIFSKQQFKSIIKTTNPEEIAHIYQETIKLCIEKINSILFYYDFEAIVEKGKTRIISIGESLDHLEECFGDRGIDNLSTPPLNYTILSNLLLHSRSKDEALSWIKIILSIGDFSDNLIKNIKEQYNTNDILTFKVVTDELQKLFEKID